MTYAFVRQLSGDESLLRQRASILQYARERELELDEEMIEFEPADRPLKERRLFQEFLHSLGEGDRIVVERIEILGRAMDEVIVVINCMLSRGISLHLCSPALEVEKQTGLARILPLIVRLGENPAPARKDQRVGRPKGRRSASKFDVHLPRIMEGLKAGRSVSAIARELAVSRSSLKDYIESRRLRQYLDDSWLEEAKKSFHYEAALEPDLACTLNEDGKMTRSSNSYKGTDDARSHA